MHLTNVQKYSKMIALELGYSESDAEILGDAASLHDVGKTMIPSNILNKPGKLTPEEYEIMKTHTTEGARLIDSFCNPNEVDVMAITAYDIALHHHERYDGKGYPDGLKGSEIPIEAQVVSLSDVYDALTSERCYKKAFTHDKAIEMIINGECGKFNPDLIECLKNVEADFQQILKNQNYTKLKNYKLERAN